MKWRFWRKDIREQEHMTRESWMSRHAMRMQPVLGAGCGYEYGVCTNPFCGWHYKDSRFVWENGRWTLKPEIQEQGFRLKEAYYKKYGDYGPARDRPENIGLFQSMGAYR